MYNYEEEYWNADLLYLNKTFDGEIAGYPMYNSPFASRSQVYGYTMAFSWIDTDLEGVEENTNPDIYTILCARDYYQQYSYSDVYNVTALLKLCGSYIYDTIQACFSLLL